METLTLNSLLNNLAYGNEYKLHTKEYAEQTLTGDGEYFYFNSARFNMEDFVEKLREMTITGLWQIIVTPYKLTL